FPLGVWLSRNGGKATEGKAKAGADSVPASRPDPEVVAKPKRRTYTAEYKQRILQEAEVAATTRGGLGALLRREALYSSLLAYWRRERAHGILEDLRKAHIIIDVQKKVAALLGNPIPDQDPEEKP